MTIERAIDLLVNEFEKAKQMPCVHKPVAWALYQTWKLADGEEIPAGEKKLAILQLLSDNDPMTVGTITGGLAEEYGIYMSESSVRQYITSMSLYMPITEDVRGRNTFYSIVKEGA